MDNIYNKRGGCPGCPPIKKISKINFAYKLFV